MTNTQNSLLAIFAHPDDEAFGTGGTLSRYASEGKTVGLVCATRGEVGEISDPSFATPETLGAVREGELRCAAETMGVCELIFLNYRDSGMIGTPENMDPRAFMNAPEGEVVEQLVEIIRRLKPQVITTFEPFGGYGHPDHIAIHNHTVSAFHIAADPIQYPQHGSAWQAERLFYTVIPRSFFLDMRRQMVELGIDTSDLDRFDDPKMGWPDEKINVWMDVASTVEYKWEALNCHRTQFGPGNLFRQLPELQVKKLMATEYFSLAWPEPESGMRLPGLFADIKK